jgi:RNA polymerase-binding transcription factor DksA
MAKSKKSKPKAKAAKATKPKASKPAARGARTALKKHAKKAKPAPAAKSKALKKPKPAPKPVHKAGHNNKNSVSHKKASLKPDRSEKPAPSKAPVAKSAPSAKPVKMTPFLKEQHKRLLFLRDAMLDSMAGVAKDNLRSRAEGSEASAFGMHQADAGSDAYDRDFALNLLSQEQDALYEIEEALKRVDSGSYGICELCGKPIPQARLEVIPFTRFTVDCQSKLEKERKLTRSRQPVTSLFGLTDDEDAAEGEEEETPAAEPKE